MWGNFLQKNIATFRCYGNILQAKYYVPPHPFKKALSKNIRRKFQTHGETVGADRGVQS